MRKSTPSKRSTPARFGSAAVAVFPSKEIRYQKKPAVEIVADHLVADDLATDNAAYAVIPEPRRLRVLLAGPGNAFLEKALEAMDEEASEAHREGVAMTLKMQLFFDTQRLSGVEGRGVGIPVTAHGGRHVDHTDVVFQRVVPVADMLLQPVAVRAAKPERFGHFNLAFFHLRGDRRRQQRVVLTFHQLLGTDRSGKT